VRTPRYKFISFDGDKVDQLFDLEKDPGETKNLATSSAHSGAIEEHRKLLREWERGLEIAPGLPSGNAWWRRR
jgi:choline-sulfatase